ncbi:hypothetical protein TRE132_14410 [Pseudomonas chlororaphis subsp. aurantiaca]|nr:hypothetical protein TRE132_14410 [Pseudomonas chlororaphis subsp. aurantiaca]
MQQTETKHPIAELVEALEDLDQESTLVRLAKADLAKANAQFETARQRASRAYFPAFEAAAQMGESIGSTFQRSDSLITFDEEGGVSVAPFDCKYIFELKQMLQEKTPQEGKQSAG